jgi:CheY-like chemotaxis protein
MIENIKKKRPTILVVEDESIIALDMKEKLGALEYEVVGIATTGREAIEKAADLRPELILMDIILPGKSTGSPPPGSSRTNSTSRSFI